MKKTNLTIIIGLGKTGMSCVRHLACKNCNLAIVDNRTNPPCLEELRRDFPQIPVFLGTFDAAIIDEAQEIILSPGVSLQTPSIVRAHTRSVPVIGDIELFARVAHAPIVAITGSNGKSTVTTLVGEMAKNAGIKVKVGGNLGTPTLDLLDPHAELYVLELSSFQLETTHSLKTKAAVILNVTEDHMDRYCSFDEYLFAKQKIFRNCEIAVINRDDPVSYSGAKLPEKVMCFGLRQISAGTTLELSSLQNHPTDFFIHDGYITHANKKLLKINELKIKGLHQVANALAALALGTAINLPEKAMLKTLREFPGLKHRCQWVAKIDEVDWYNDSKGTNVGATEAAIKGLGQEIKGKIILIAGGLGKDADFTPLQKPVKQYARAVILIGKDAPKIEEAIKDHTKIIHANSMKNAVLLAKQAAEPHDIVLLSPACASFDMFDNFEHRGDEFVKEVKEIH